jgi:rhodanese-related sulfurtransferase
MGFRFTQDRGQAGGLATFLLLLAFLGGGPATRAESQGAEKPTPPGPYCGLYCVYGALQVVGKGVPFESILRPRYLASRQGSTIRELRQAVEDAGGHAQAFSGLGAESLRTARHPMVLHVARDGQLRQYNHWVLFCGMQDGKARIVDPPNPMQLMAISDILARWNGTALIVSGDKAAAPPREGDFYLTHVALALIVVWGFSLAATRIAARPVSRRPRIALYQAGVVTAAAIMLSLATHVLDDAAFLRNPSATRYVAAANIARFFPKLDLEGARQFVRNGKGLIVDARFPDTFARGTIPGAINLPIDASPSERRAKMKHIARGTPLLVFCQSSTCEYDEFVATLLAGDGFESITLFTGGWREWTSDERDKSGSH